MIEHKRGDTFTAKCVRRDGNGLPFNLTDTTIRSQARISGENPFTINFVAVVTDAPNGLFELRASAAQAANWPIGVYRCDVEFTKNTVVDSSDTFEITILEDITI